MPELPEVEIARINLQSWWQGKTATEVVIADETLLEETEPQALVAAFEQRVHAVERRGKYIVVRMADQATVLIHFRMTGKITRSGRPDSDYARIAWRVPPAGDEWLVFIDQRRLGTMRLLEPGQFDSYEPVQKLGPDALEVTAEMLDESLAKRRMLKTTLMDQEVLAGLGNIAATEIMWRMSLAPRTKCGALSAEDRQELAATIRRFINHVIDVESGDEVVYLSEDRPDNPFDVYRRLGESCPRCSTAIERVKVAGRSTYYCPGCQK